VKSSPGRLRPALRATRYREWTARLTVRSNGRHGWFARAPVEDGGSADLQSLKMFQDASWGCAIDESHTPTAALR
jgi:hypothetical protein